MRMLIHMAISGIHMNWFCSGSRWIWSTKRLWSRSCSGHTLDSTRLGRSAMMVSKGRFNLPRWVKLTPWRAHDCFNQTPDSTSLSPPTCPFFLLSWRCWQLIQAWCCCAALDVFSQTISLPFKGTGLGSLRKGCIFSGFPGSHEQCKKST